MASVLKMAASHLCLMSLSLLSDSLESPARGQNAPHDVLYNALEDCQTLVLGETLRGPISEYQDPSLTSFRGL